MARSLLFHLDEHMDHAIANGLRRRGINVTTTVELGLRTHNDVEQLAACERLNRVLVTCDSDFVVLHQQGQVHHGIIKFRDEQRHDVGAIIRYIELVWEVMDTADMIQHLEYA